MAFFTLSTPQISIDGVNIAIVPNSCTLTEGFGAQTVMVQSAGGGAVSQVISNDVSTNFSTVKFSFFNTEENIEFFRAIKSQSRTPHLVQINDGRSFTRAIADAIVTNDYEVTLQSDGQTAIEISGSAAV